MQKKIPCLLYSLLLFGFSHAALADDSKAKERQQTANCRQQALDHGFKTKSEIAEYLIECKQELNSDGPGEQAASKAPEVFPYEPND